MTPSPLRWGYLPLADSIASLLCCREMTRAGVPWEPVKFANNHLLLEALRQREIEGGVSSAVFLPELEADKEGVKILGAASREGITVFTSAEGKFKNLSNLKGATIALPAKATVHGALLYKVLASLGLQKSKEVTIKTLPPAEGFKALAKGEVDLVLALEPLASRIAAEGKFLPVAHSRELWPRHLSFVALISSEKVTQNPGLTNLWEASYEKALERIAGDYAEVARETAPLLGVDPANLLSIRQGAAPNILYHPEEISPGERADWRELVAAIKRWD